MLEDLLIVVNTEFGLDVDNDLKKVMKIIISDILIKNDFDLSPLDRIVLTQYFSEQLKLLSAFSSNEIKYTNNENSVACAKCVSLLVDKTFVDVLVLSNAFIEKLLGDNLFAINILHHELVHIHEKSALKSNKAMYDFNFTRVSEIEYNYLPISITAWSEYYANYISSSSLTNESISDQLRGFALHLETLEKNVIEKRILYRTNQLDLNTFFHSYFKVYADGLYLSAAYLIGTCHGIQNRLQELSPEIYDVLDGHLFQSTYNEMENIFQDMFQGFPNEWDEKVYDALNTNILEYYLKLGISFTQTEKRVYTNVFEPQ